MPDETEKDIAIFQADAAKYWRDYSFMALAGMFVAGVALIVLDVPHPAIGSLGAILAVAVRALYLRSETMALRWRLTASHVHHPDGQRKIPLIELETIRTLLGDVQLITRSGDKYLLKHLADGPGTVALITQTRDKRARRRA